MDDYVRANTMKVRTSMAIDAGLGLMLALLAAWANVLWVEHNRFGLAVTIDEAGYMSQAIAYANALKYGGISGWLAALGYPTKFAPLSPMVSSILMAALGVSENVAFYTHILFYAALILVTFWWVRERSSRAAAISAALLIASVPDIVLYTRTYQYGLPTAFFFLLANFAYHKSDRFSLWTWSLVTGAALGAMLLSRTMTIAFVPAFGLVWLLDSRNVLTRRIGRVAASVGSFLLVAAPWYVLNLKEIFGYLFAFGYGAPSNEYGSGATSVLSLSYLFSRIQGFMDSLYLFHFVLVFVVFWACVIGQAARFYRTRRIEDRGLAVPTWIVVLCVIILFSSKNRGSGFEIPLFAVMALCSVCTIYDVIKSKVFRMAVYSAISLCALMLGYLQSTTTSCESAPDFIARPLLSSTPIRICDGYVSQYLRATDAAHLANLSNWKGVSHFDQKQWRGVSAQIADRLHEVDKSKNLVIYVTRNRLVNVNTVQLDFVEKFGFILPAAQIEPGMLSTDLEYRKWFDDTSQAKACAIVMMSDTRGDFFPRPHLGALSRIVQERGFTLTDRIATPESGMYAELWTSMIGCGDEQK